jgi:hypothetical protein
LFRTWKSEKILTFQSLALLPAYSHFRIRCTTLKFGLAETLFLLFCRHQKSENKIYCSFVSRLHHEKLQLLKAVAICWGREGKLKKLCTLFFLNEVLRKHPRHRCTPTKIRHGSLTLSDEKQAFA